MLPPFRLVTSCAPGGTLKKSNGMEPPRADHGEAAAPRQCRDRCGEGRVHSDAVQDECRPDSSGELTNLVRGIRTTQHGVVGAALSGQPQPGFVRIDSDDSCASQLPKKLNRVESQPADSNHDRHAARPDRGTAGDGAVGDAGIRERRSATGSRSPIGTRNLASGTRTYGACPPS